LQTGPVRLTCCLVLVAGHPCPPVFNHLWALLFPSCSQVQWPSRRLSARCEPERSESASVNFRTLCKCVAIASATVNVTVRNVTSLRKIERQLVWVGAGRSLYASASRDGADPHRRELHQAMIAYRIPTTARTREVDTDADGACTRNRCAPTTATALTALPGLTVNAVPEPVCGPSSPRSLGPRWLTPVAVVTPTTVQKLHSYAASR
jgi:hypothetical protein